MEKIEVKKPKNQVRKIAAFIANNGGKIDEITRLKLANLETWLTIEQSAREKIRKEGLTLTYNKGTSVGVSPIYKIFTDAHKFILKYLNELGLKPEQIEGESPNPFAQMDE